MPPKKESGAHGEAPLDVTLAGIRKKFGATSVMMLEGDEGPGLEPVSVISSGSIGLDRALGIGGFARGRITEIYGPESGGKTTIALSAIAQSQQQGGVAAFIDAEHALNPEWTTALGIDNSRLMVSQPDSGEQGLEIADWLIRSGSVDIVVIDSVAALVPQAEIDGDMGDQRPGLQARLMSQACRKMVGGFTDKRAACIFINQLREKIGVVFGNPETTAGGKALKFYASVRVDVRIASRITKDGEVIGNKLRAKVVKNKMSPPHRQAEFDLLFGKGISRSGELLQYGVDLGLIKKSGSYYTSGTLTLGNGFDSARMALEHAPADFLSSLEQQVHSLLSSTQAAAVAPDVAAAEPEGLLQDGNGENPFVLPDRA